MRTVLRSARLLAGGAERQLRTFPDAIRRAFCTVTMSWWGYENQLAFAHPDDSSVVLVQDDLAEDTAVTFAAGDEASDATLPADSFSTFVIGV